MYSTSKSRMSKALATVKLHLPDAIYASSALSALKQHVTMTHVIVQSEPVLLLHCEPMP